MPQSTPSSSAQQQPFLFGVATADHQCEAYEPACRDIRDEWEERRHLTLRGQATDFWNRYPEDHVEQYGGPTGDGFCDLYLRYVTEVVKHFGPLVRYWIPFNEPSQLIYGSVKPWWVQNYFMPPGLPVSATLEEQLLQVNALMRHLFLAHTEHGRENRALLQTGHELVTNLSKCALMQV